MNRIHRTLLGSFLLLCTGLVAQTKTPTVADQPGSFPETSFKKSKLMESPEIRGEDVLWKRDVYRMVDLTNGINASLYYPVEPSADRMNLFCTLFDLVATGKLTAYEFLDGREVFSDAYAIKFKDLLKRFEIPFKEKPDPKKAGNTIFDINAVDIPSAEVTLFYVKEAYYLEQRTSTMGIKTLAICPVLNRTDENGETRKYPMFWIPFDALKPYLGQIPVASDTINSVSRMNAYDFFRQHRYQGDIYKVSNLRNLSLYDYCKTPEAIKAEQERLEKELKAMNNALWEPSQRDLREAEAEKAAQDKAKMDAQRKKKGRQSKSATPAESPKKG